MICTTLPTGYLFTDSYSKGKLETLSIGDYGKHHNVKADFLGYTRLIQGVPNTQCMPLSEKWVVTLSTQYGCQMRCTFCDVPKVKWQGNATFNDLKSQLYKAISLFPEVQYTERLNIHFARMGEPIFNEAVFKFSEWLFENKDLFQLETGLRTEVIHPILTTSLPRSYKKLKPQLLHWASIKNHVYNGQAGLQLSINSTNETQRSQMFNNMQLELNEVSKIAKDLSNPISRKYCLNFAYSTDFEIDAKKLTKLFNPDHFMVKITPIHNNNVCKENNIQTLKGYTSWEPYEEIEKTLTAEGWDTLVFIPSLDEENSLVTCGNAILSGSELKVEKPISIYGI